MNLLQPAFTTLLLLLMGQACSPVQPNSDPSPSLDDMMIRIAALEIDSTYLDEYLRILQEEAAASVQLEPGVLCIFPMYEKENPTSIRLLEIYANEAAYQSHLKTPHFLHYKTSTQAMVKSLELIDMEAMDRDIMPEIFRKIHKR